jgi:hypothetical protein
MYQKMKIIKRNVVFIWLFNDAVCIETIYVFDVHFSTLNTVARWVDIGLSELDVNS